MVKCNESCVLILIYDKIGNKVEGEELIYRVREKGGWELLINHGLMQ